MTVTEHAERSRSARRSGYRWVVLVIATFAQACACFFVQGLGSITVYLQREMHLSTTQIGLLVTAAQLVPLAGLLVAGELLDRYPERWVVGAGSVIVGAGLLGGSAAPGYGWLLVGLLVVGAGYSTAQPGGSKSVASWFATSQRGFAMGIRQAGLPLGGALAAALLPWLARSYGWRAPLVASGALALVGGAVFMGFYRSPDLPSADASRSASLRVQLAARFEVARAPAMITIILSGVSMTSLQYGLSLLTELYLHTKASMPVGQAASFLLLMLGCGVVGRIVLAAWSDRSTGRLVPVLTCMSCAATGLLVWAVAPLHSALFVGGLVAWLGFFGFGWYGPWVAYVADCSPPGKSGFALGLAMAVNQIAVILVPPGLGLLKDSTGSFVPDFSILALFAMSALGAVLWRTAIRPST
ncbi:MFS transporter [Streptomyces sp. NBC_01198]|uniref:MFS transporter n=1 Tax=Streptomyces sp. NBC_01198 TaxID=2903769 RepID=UPI002E10F5E3|nr:MFS transporter [Streptomyces sp. NBC_01198]WSR66423.1 MFS transporter [Streptomyces sp. NBC_01198]